MYSIASHLPVFSIGGPSHFTITGIDPGSVTLGVADIHVNIETLEIEGLEHRTFNANKAHNGLPIDTWMSEIYSERAMRMQELGWRLGHHFNFMRPLFIAVETAYFDIRTPTAFIPLAECIKVIELTTLRWNGFRGIHRIETSVAKKSVAPESKSLQEEYKALCKSKALVDSKAKVRWCAERHSEFARIIQGTDIDEHSLDAAVVAYAQLLRIRNNDFTITF